MKTLSPEVLIVKRKLSTESIFYVYAYFDKDGVPRYIGKGKGYRIREHRTKTPKYRLAKAIASGEMFTSRKIAENLSEMEAFDLERRWIAKFGREIDGGVLWNLTLGGDGMSGVIRSDEFRARMSEIQRYPAVRAKNSSAHLGRPKHPDAIAKTAAFWRTHKHSEESRKKISQAQIGKKLSDDHKKKLSISGKGKKRKSETCVRISMAKMKPVECVETGEFFASIREAASSLGVNACCLSDMLRGAQKTVCGLHFRFAERISG